MKDRRGFFGQRINSVAKGLFHRHRIILKGRRRSGVVWNWIGTYDDLRLHYCKSAPLLWVRM
jgi:hypothetical protein